MRGSTRSYGPSKQAMPDDLWRNFPKTAPEFEARFATEADCRAYWIAARWGGTPACARCNGTRLWSERDGFLFECADCGHQTSLTSGTLLEKTRKPFKVWFHAPCSRSAHVATASRPWNCNASWASAHTRRRGPGCTSCAPPWCAPIGSRCALPCRPTRRSSGKGLAPQGAGSGGGRGRRKGASRPRRQQ